MSEPKRVTSGKLRWWAGLETVNDDVRLMACELLELRVAIKCPLRGGTRECMTCGFTQCVAAHTSGKEILHQHWPPEEAHDERS